MNLFCAIYGNGFLRFLLPAHRRKPEKYEITEKEKKTMKKKLFSMFLALVMIVSVFPVGGLAAEAQEEEKTLAVKPPMVDDSSTVKMLSTEINFAEKDLSPKPKTGAPSEVPDTPYEAYRDPEAMLSDDEGYCWGDAGVRFHIEWRSGRYKNCVCGKRRAAESCF